MGAMVLIIIDEARENAVQMGFIENDDVIQALTTDRTDQPLDKWILPG